VSPVVFRGDGFLYAPGGAQRSDAPRGSTAEPRGAALTLCPAV